MIGKNIVELLFPSDDRREHDACTEDVMHYGEWNGEQRQRKKNNGAILVESNWRKIENRFTGTSSYLIVNTDITERRALEHRSLRNQKMEAIALMTSGIAHDLQNILAPVSLSIGVLREHFVAPSKEYILDTIEESTNKGLNLVKGILMVGKGLKGAKRPVDLVVIIGSALGSFHHGKPENIHVGQTFTLRECLVSGDDSLLGQVFANLFQNAKDAMPQGGTLSVALTTVDGRTLNGTADLERGDGSLIVTSSIGRGTSFVIYLPVHAA